MFVNAIGKSFRRLPTLFQFILAVTALTLVILFGMRAIFWGMFHNPADPLPTKDLLYAFYLGTKFDLRLTLYVLLPLFFLGGLKWFDPFNNRFARYFWLIYLVLVATIVLAFYLVDFGHYAYLHSRLNATVLRFLDNFDTSAQMVWQSYSVIPWSLAVIALIALDAYVIHFLIRYFTAHRTPYLKIRHRLWVAPVAFFIFVFGMYGKFSYYPLRWSDAFFSTNTYAASVATNPVLNFFETMKNRFVLANPDKVREYYDVVSQYLGVDKPDKASLNFTRHIPAKPDKMEPPPNIVMVFLESFAGYKTGVLGNPLKPTPYFDALCNDGVLFTNYFVPAVGTAHSVWAMLTGIPDVEVHKTSTRNPLAVDQHTIVNAFKGYEKYYFIGGSANWANIRGVLQHNIKDLHLYEEGDYTSPRMDVWGIDDLSLFLEADKVLTKQKKPFFAIIQTAGNHRPFHIPEDSHGFKRQKVDQKTLSRNAFYDLDEYNAFRFMDYSIGYFIKQAKTQPYFKNTIFVFYGDHGITDYAGAFSEPWLTPTKLSGMYTPLLIYAPKLLKPERVTKIASELDLLPTMAGLAGIEYNDTTLGRDLFDPKYDDRREAFTITHYQVPEIGLLNKDYYYMTMADGKDPRLFALKDFNNKNILEEQPEVAKRMHDLTVGLYETSKYMLYHNKNLLVKQTQ
ncbi:MAG: sulfatase-like hydrolase/transferase [Gammaproteobacteria bacterium]|nr:sulfatase-like hydrolase/transferase [Gammaproteobacteria bacterium]